MDCPSSNTNWADTNRVRLHALLRGDVSQVEVVARLAGQDAEQPRRSPGARVDDYSAWLGFVLVDLQYQLNKYCEIMNSELTICAEAVATMRGAESRPWIGLS